MFFAAGPVEAAVTNKALGLEAPADARHGGLRQLRGGDLGARGRASPGATISSATSSPPPTSMSARISAGACSSARWRSARPSSAISSGSAPAGRRPRARDRRRPDSRKRTAPRIGRGARRAPSAGIDGPAGHVHSFATNIKPLAASSAGGRRRPMRSSSWNGEAGLDGVARTEGDGPVRASWSSAISSSSCTTGMEQILKAAGYNSPCSTPSVPASASGHQERCYATCRPPTCRPSSHALQGLTASRTPPTWAPRVSCCRSSARPTRPAQILDCMKSCRRPAGRPPGDHPRSLPPSTTMRSSPRPTAGHAVRPDRDAPGGRTPPRSPRWIASTASQSAISTSALTRRPGPVDHKDFTDAVSPVAKACQRHRRERSTVLCRPSTTRSTLHAQASTSSAVRATFGAAGRLHAGLDQISDGPQRAAKAKDRARAGKKEEEMTLGRLRWASFASRSGGDFKKADGSTTFPGF